MLHTMKVGDKNIERDAPNHNYQDFEDLGIVRVRRDGDSMTHYIPIIMGYDGVSRAQLKKWASAGSSRRVELQKSLRNLSDDRLDELEDIGLVVHAKDVNDPIKTPEQRKAEAMAALQALPEHLRNSILAQMAKEQQEAQDIPDETA